MRSCSPSPVHTQQLVATKNSQLRHRLRIWSHLARGQRAQIRFRIPRSVSSLQPTHQLVCCHLKAIEKPLTGRTGRAAVQHTSVQAECGCCEHQLERTIPGTVAPGALSISRATIARAAVVAADPPRGLAELQLLNENEFEAFCTIMEQSLASIMHPEVNCYLSQGSK